MDKHSLNAQPAVLVYDGQCPFCANYSRRLRVQKSVGDLRLVDAREHSAIRQEISDRGLDLDQGMVLKLGDRLYYGEDAMHAIALISSGSGLFNRINAWVFRSQRLSALLYPVLRCGRNLILRVLGISKINNLRSD